jgi:methylase of polypeptide subunit release factors
LHQRLLSILKETEVTNDHTAWKEAIEDSANSVADGFLAIMDYGFKKGIFCNCPFKNFDDWLTRAEDNRVPCLDPSANLDAGDLVLFDLWEQFRSTLIQLLRKSRKMGEIPSAGGLQVFICGLNKCLLIAYEEIGETAKFKLIKIIHNPKALFDFWEETNNADADTRNRLKEFLVSGYKLVIHRGILIHIDRRKDFDVFGPSIDTLILAEVLAQQVFESDLKSKTALEIGCGNGLLTTALASYGKYLHELFAIDINFEAISCTKRNVFSNDGFLTRPTNLFFVNGWFQPDLFNRKFDLVVCNPPYIPVPPTLILETTRVGEYFQAVGGTSLLETVLKSVPKLLMPGGKLLLMASSLSLQDTLRLVPPMCEIERPFGEEGQEVEFDVEAVLHNPDWLSFLITERGLISRGKLYFHKLHPMWIKYCGE